MASKIKSLSILKKKLKFIRRKVDPVIWQNFRSTIPTSTVFGFDRGTPIDRYYIECFLKNNSKDIKGIVLEIGENIYTAKFGRNNIVKSEILHYDASNLEATIIGDLTQLNTLPQNAIDCFICTQTFNFIYDYKAAIRGAHHLLNEGGILLTTLGGISQISKYDMERWGDYWRFTTLSALKSFEDIFGKGNVEVDCYGNVLSSIAFLKGIASEELTFEELEYKDENYQLLITIRAIKRKSV